MAQTAVVDALSVADWVLAVLVAGCRVPDALILRTVRHVTQTHAILWDAPAKAHINIQYHGKVFAP